MHLCMSLVETVDGSRAVQQVLESWNLMIAQRSREFCVGPSTNLPFPSMVSGYIERIDRYRTGSDSCDNKQPSVW